jgi:hypothetical protein
MSAGFCEGPVVAKITTTHPIFAEGVARTAWRRLRQMRSDPPGEAAKPPRRAVFSAALEQAEQLFSGAASADYMIKPILVFYGFNQACRAMAACCTQLNDQTFRPLGHGLSAPDTQGDLADLKLTPAQASRKRKQDSMLATLQAMLGSPSWSDPSTVGQIWSANPDLADVRLPSSRDPVAVWIGINATTHDPAVPLHVVIHQVSGLSGTGESDILQLLRTSYPTVADTLPPDSRHFDGNPPPPLIIEGNGKANLHRSLPLNGRNPTELIDQKTMWRENNTWLIPKIGGSDAVPHVLVLWWALLFGLSMRDRYEPEGWTTDLDPDKNGDAVTLEIMLDKSMAECPELIVDTITSWQT